MLPDPACGSEKLVWAGCGPTTAKRHKGDRCLGLVGGVMEGSTVGSKVESQGCAGVIACGLMDSVVHR